MSPTCLDCGDEYEQPRRLASHFCPTCRRKRRHTRELERQRERYGAVKAARDEAEHRRALGMSDAYVERYHDMIDDVIDDADALRALAGHDGMVLDRMPPGANSPAGPDDGTSTYFADLADDLDEHARKVALHPWFAANPHWSYRVHDPIGTLPNLKAS